MAPARNNIIAVYLAAAVLALALLAYGLRLVDQVREADQAWQTLVSQAKELEKGLHDVVHALGYGGFVHRFNDYLLHRDPDVLRALEGALEEAQAGLARMRALPLPATRSADLDELGHVVELYGTKLELARILVAQGRSPQVIDRMVAVDERKALAAIASLESYAAREQERSHQQIELALQAVVEQLRYSGLLVLPIAWVAMLVAGDRRQMRDANARLAQANRYVQDLIEGAPDALLVIGEGGRIRQANLAAERLLRYGRAELLQLTVEDLMPPRYRDGHRILRDQARDTRQTRSMGANARLLALTADGSEVPVEISLSHSEQPDGLVSLVTLRDVTDRERLNVLLAERQEALQTAQAIAHIGSWDWRLADHRFTWSDETGRILGHLPGSVTASRDALLDQVHPADHARVAQAMDAARQDGEPFELEHRVLRPDGEQRVVQQRARVFRDSDGRPERVIGTVLDITERKAIERELLFDQAIIERSSQPILVVDDSKRIVDVNDAFCSMSGYGRDELIGQAPNLLKSGRHDQAFYESMWEAVRGRHHWHGEIMNRHKDGGLMPQLLSINRICEPSSEVCRYVGFYSDITSLKENQARLEKLAHFDPLTGLANRMLCQDRLRAALARARRSGTQLAVLFLDLDGFKAVNDRLGHQTGDTLLVQVAEGLTRSVREDDTVARLGGDEFVVILNDVNGVGGLRPLVERVLDATRVTLVDGDVSLLVSGSIGVARYPNDGEDGDTLLERADQAMYRAKQAGRDRLVFFSGD